MTKIEGLDENLTPQSSDWIPIQPPGQKIKKIRLGNLPTQADNSALEAQVNNLEKNKVDKADLVTTVSVLEQQIGNKAPMAHNHTINEIIGSDALTINTWNFVTANTALVNTSQKIIVSASNDLTINVSNNTREIDVKRLDSTKLIKVTGISRINGRSVSSSSELRIGYSDGWTKLLKADNAEWYGIPESTIQVVSPLVLPTDGLTRLYYTPIINANDGALINEWRDDTGSGFNAKETSTLLFPTLKTGIFQPDIPGLLFNGSQRLSAYFGLEGKKYSIVLVEARTSNKTENYAIKQGGATGVGNSFHLGYRSDTQFTLDHWGNGINAGVPSYSNLIRRIWVASNNSRGKELYLNGTRVIASTDTTNLNLATDFSIGGFGGSQSYIGYVGLVGVYEGEKSIAQNQAISNAVNNKFGIY